MLPIGYIAPYMAAPRYSRFSLAEAQSLMTLMVMARAPLIWGGTASDARANATTVALIANSAVSSIYLREKTNHIRAVFLNILK